MQVKKVFCDKCKKEITTKKFYGIEINSKEQSNSCIRYTDDVTIVRDLCQDCYNKLFWILTREN